MAFPTTSVIDSFNRSNESPIASPWSAETCRPTLSSAMLDIISQTVGDADSTGSYSSQYYASSTYGPDCEVYCTITSLPGAYQAVSLYARITGTDPDYCYWARASTTENVTQIWKTVNNAHTQLGADISLTLATGDSLGLEIIGTTIKLYRKPSAGPWSEIASRTDSDITEAGYIGFGVNDAVCRLDDFGGGTVVTGGGGTPGSIWPTITL